MVRSSKMKDDKGPIKSPGKENESELENGKKKTKEERPATKIVVRRLPPTMTADQFKLQVSPLPEIDYFYFVPADISLMPNAFSRAYINFVDQSDLFIFTQKFDGYVFIDSKGGEFPAVVEFAPFQRIPKNRPNRKKDPKVGTIESDPIYIQFKELLEALSLENKTTANASKQHFFETTLEPERKEASNTPLLDFIKNKRAERQRIRDEKREEKRKRDLERKRVKEEQRRIRKDDDTSVLKVLNNQSASSRERIREKETKPTFVKKKFDDVKLAPKEKSVDTRTKDSKSRTGKSYLEERQRQAERREEQKKKLSQNSTTVTDTKLSTEDKTVVSEEGISDEKPNESGSKIKDSDFKRTERLYKRDEGRGSSYKYESKREREGEIRSRRANDKSYQNRRDDERPEDSGRKRYSETRRNYDSPRERYKDKDKNKAFSSKKTTESITDIDSTAEKISKHQQDIDETASNNDKIESTFRETDNVVLSGDRYNKANKNIPEENISELGKKTKQYESKNKVNPTRRKSFDYDKNRQSSYNSSKSNNKEKFSEKKRRNSFGSGKNKDSLDAKTHHVRNTSDAETKELFLDTASEQSLKKVSELDKQIPHNEEIFTEKDSLKKEFEINDRSIPKRRNSTGERQSLEKLPSRRNSLGSEDKNMICTFDNEEHICDSNVVSAKRSKDEKKQQRNSRDPRTERRIRNKDRPSLEIYRPGMGKFSKQRLEREKGLGSSTEIESPSSSPSPTPVMKHKILAGSQH